MTTPRLTGGQHSEKQGSFAVWKLLIPVFVIIFLVVGGLFLVKSQLPQKVRPPGSTEVAVGASVSDFKLKKFNGGETGISTMPGKIFLINFWASWCEACMVEMPSIVNLRKKYVGRGLEVLLMDVDENPQAAVPSILKQFGIDFPIYVDTDGQLTDLFDVRAIPFTMIMDKSRKVLLIESGERDWNGADIAEQIDRWLAK